MGRPSTAIVGAPLAPDLLLRRISLQRGCFHRVPLEFPPAPLGPAGGFRVSAGSDALALLGDARGLPGLIGVADHSARSSRPPSQSREPRAGVPSRKWLVLVGSFSWRRFTLQESCDIGPLKRHEPPPLQYRGPDSMTCLMFRFI